MFKKILVYSLVLSPIIYALVVGYPVGIKKTGNSSQRTYEIDNERAYFQALSSQRRINKLSLLKNLNQDIANYNTWFQLVWPIGAILIVLGFFIL